jgi:thioredoxin 1
MSDLARASVEITDGSFDAEVVRSPLPVLVESWASWCEPYRNMAPVMAKLSGEYTGRVRVGRLDVDASLATVQEPTMRA